MLIDADALLWKPMRAGVPGAILVAVSHTGTDAEA